MGLWAKYEAHAYSADVFFLSFFSFIANGQNRPSLWAFAFCNLLAWFFRTVLNMNLVTKRLGED
jgi:hypothetical protein